MDRNSNLNDAELVKDAERWRTFLSVAEKEINRDKGYIKFYIPGYFSPNQQIGYLTFIQAIDKLSQEKTL